MKMLKNLSIFKLTAAIFSYQFSIDAISIKVAETDRIESKIKYLMSKSDI